MGWLNIAVVLYGLLNIALGAYAYFHSKSIVSLAAGGGAGLLALVAAFIAKDNPRVGYIMAAVVAFLILGRFAKPFFAEGKIYPAGILVAASVLLLILLVVGHFAGRRV